MSDKLTYLHKEVMWHRENPDCGTNLSLQIVARPKSPCSSLEISHFSCALSPGCVGSACCSNLGIDNLRTLKNANVHSQLFIINIYLWVIDKSKIMWQIYFSEKERKIAKEKKKKRNKRMKRELKRREEIENCWEK